MQKKIYTFKKTDKGIQGKAFEMAIKNALNRPNPDTVSPAGQPDFRYHHYNYDCKQNGTVIKYDSHKQYIKGSNRVIYASHIDFDIVGETDKTVSIIVNLENTQMFILDRFELVNYLLENNKAKYNPSRNCINIQTLYNYKKKEYHGTAGKALERWAFEHEIDDDIISDILGF